MAYDKMINSVQLNNNLTSIANTIREKSNTNNSMSFPDDFITNIQNIPYYTEDGFIDGDYGEEGRFSATILNNTFSNFTTSGVGVRYYFQLKRPILIHKNDIIQVKFKNKTGTKGYSYCDILTVPYGMLTINDNFSLGDKKDTSISKTETTYDNYEITAIGMGPRHTTIWDNFGATVQFFINGQQIF